MHRRVSLTHGGIVSSPGRAVNNKKGLFDLVSSNRIVRASTRAVGIRQHPRTRNDMISYLAEYGILFCLVSAVVMLPGLVVAGLAFRDPRMRALRPLICTALGPAIWMASVFVLAMIGQLNLLSVILLSVCWVALAFAFRSRLELRTPTWDGQGLGVRGGTRREGRSLIRLRGAPAFTSFRRGESPWEAVAVLKSRSARALVRPAVFVVLVAPCFILASSPDVAWDAGVYHLALPKLYIAGHGFHSVAMNVYANWPLNTELLFAGAMLVKDYILATTLHWGFGILCLYAIHTLCRVFDRPGGAWLAMALFLTNHIVLWEMTIAYIDLAYAFFFAAAFIFALWTMDNRPNRKAALLLCGICCGILTGIKLSGILGAAAIGVMLLFRLRSLHRGERWGEVWSLLGRFILPIVLLALPWVVKSAWHTGNPVYPFLHAWFGGPDWSPSLSGQLAAWQKSIGMGAAAIDYLLLPLRAILMGDVGYAHFDGRICRWWIVLIPLAVVFGRQLPLVRRCLGTAGVYFVLWSVSSQQMRFLIPILPLLAVATAVAIDDRIGRMRRAHLRGPVACGCLIAAVLTAAGVNAGNYVNAFRFLQRLHAQGDAARQMAVPPAHRFINESLPASARVLCLNTNQGFFLDRDYLADSFFEASQIADWLRPADSRARIMACLAERGITHVLVEHKDWGIAYPPALIEVLSDDNLMRPVYRSPDNRFDVLELQKRGILQMTLPRS